MKYAFFFATPADIGPVLRRFEAHAQLKFVDVVILPTPHRNVFIRSADLPNPGIATNEAGGGSTTFMVSHRDKKNDLHTFVDVKCRRCWALSNGDSEETVLLTLAGIWKTRTLLPENMNTLYKTLVAQQLMRWFLSALKKEYFTRVDRWWLGREAFEMLKAGKRLSTTAEQSPPEFDLKLSRA